MLIHNYDAAELEYNPKRVELQTHSRAYVPYKTVCKNVIHSFFYYVQNMLSQLTAKVEQNYWYI